MKRAGIDINLIRQMKTYQDKTEPDYWTNFLPNPAFEPADEIDAIRFVQDQMLMYQAKYRLAELHLRKRYNFDVRRGFLQKTDAKFFRDLPSDFNDQFDEFYTYERIWACFGSLYTVLRDKQPICDAVRDIQRILRQLIPGIIAELRFRCMQIRYGREIALYDVSAWVDRKTKWTPRKLEAIQGEARETLLPAIIAIALQERANKPSALPDIWEGFLSLLKPTSKHLLSNALQQTKRDWKTGRPWLSIESLAEQGIDLPSPGYSDPLQKIIQDNEVSVAIAEQEAQQEGLTPIEREMLNLSNDGATYLEIARTLNTSTHNVKARLQTARRKISQKKS